MRSSASSSVTVTAASPMARLLGVLGSACQNSEKLIREFSVGLAMVGQVRCPPHLVGLTAAAQLPLLRTTLGTRQDDRRRCGRARKDHVRREAVVIWLRTVDQRPVLDELIPEAPVPLM
jgi:hypothetical protein